MSNARSIEIFLLLNFMTTSLVISLIEFCSINILSKVIRSLTLMPLLLKIDILGILEKDKSAMLDNSTEKLKKYKLIKNNPPLKDLDYSPIGRKPLELKDLINKLFDISITGKIDISYLKKLTDKCLFVVLNSVTITPVDISTYKLLQSEGSDTKKYKGINKQSVDKFDIINEINFKSGCLAWI